VTIAMPDSIYADRLPRGYPAYLGYVDGEWPTAPELERLFPAAQIVRLTVTGATTAADGCDIETGDLSVARGARWTRDKLLAHPASFPVLYASVSRMPGLLGNLAGQGVSRDRVRLLSAHYGAGEHICGPRTCKWPGVPDMSGTQWTNSYSTGSAIVDMSALQDNFFGSPALTATEKIVQELGIVKPGDTGITVRRVQGLLIAEGAPIAMDGVYGPATTAAVRAQQNYKHIPADGIVGPQTWPVLLGVA
jgi:hypothetical protein